jgi:hypothetical protein
MRGNNRACFVPLSCEGFLHTALLGSKWVSEGAKRPRPRESRRGSRLVGGDGTILLRATFDTQGG